MSLTAAINIGHSALIAGQAGLQVAGNNLANIATPGYTRQVARLVPQRGQFIGRGEIGQGVLVRDVQRQIDEALQARLWRGVSDEASAQESLRIYSDLEGTLNELTGYDLSTQLSDFFNSWSEEGNLVQSSAVVVQQGSQLAAFVRRMRAELTDLRSRIDTQLGATVARADELINQIAAMNAEIARAEQGQGSANSLRDQRDQLVTELSGYIDVSVIEDPRGLVDVLVGSTPVVLGGSSRGLEMRREVVDGVVEVSVVVGESRQALDVGSGTIGALLESRSTAVDDTIGTLDRVASELIFQVNRLHSTGRNVEGLRTSTGTLRIGTSEQGLALNDPANTALGSLPFAPENGGFYVTVTHRASGSTSTVRIDVDLDGLRADGTAGFDDDTSAEDIRAALGGVAGLVATFTPDGMLRVAAQEGFEFSFADDSSGALAVLGMNSYFTGSDASDIDVRAELAADPSKLARGRMVGQNLVENATALQIAGLQTRGLAALGNVSLRESWTATVQRVGLETEAADTRAIATQLVRESLESQRAAISGVSADEESINMLNFQRQYQGAARLISVADEMLQTLISIV